MNWILARLREPSTWRGLVWLLTVFGVALKPDQVEAIILAGMALAGLLGVFLKDPTRNPEERTRVADLPPIDLQGRAGNTTVSTDEWMHIVVPPRHRHEEYNDRGLPSDHPGWGG
jgi:hypothetical protein